MGATLDVVIDTFAKKVNTDYGYIDNTDIPAWLRGITHAIETPWTESDLDALVQRTERSWVFNDAADDEHFPYVQLAGSISLVFQPAGDGQVAAQLEVRIHDLGLAFAGSLEDNGEPARLLLEEIKKDDESRSAEIAIHVNAGVRAEFPDGLGCSLPRSQIFNTPFFITATLNLFGGSNSLELEEVEVDFPEELGVDPKDSSGRSKIVIRDVAFKKRQGLCGRFELRSDDDNDALISYFDNQFRVKTISFEFQTVVSSGVANPFRLNGDLSLPFFDNEIEVTLSMNPEESEYKLAFELDENEDECKSCILIPQEGDAAVCSIKITKLTGVYKDNKGLLALDGFILLEEGLANFLGIPEGDRDKYKVGFEELSIDSEGKVDLKGGWLDLSGVPALPFGPFSLQVERIGLRRTGINGKYRELSLAGEIALVEGAPPAKAGQGITVRWKVDDPDDFEIIPEKASIQLTIPGALALSGSIARVTGTQAQCYNGAESVLFRGSAALDVKAANFKIGASILAGTYCGDTVFYFFAEVESPVPIPLGQSGLGIYGVKAGAGLNTTPALEEGDELIDLYRTKPPVYDMTAASKMKPHAGAATILAGVTLGTSPDASFAARFGGLMMLSVPGPLLFIEAKAELIKLPIKVSAKEFDVSAEEFDANSTIVAGFAFDLDEKNLWVALKADFEIPATIKVGGAGEAFFDFQDASKWHLYLGKDQPRNSRIRGDLLTQYRGEGYLMLDADNVRTGARFGYGPVFDKPPLRAVLELFVEGGVGIGWSIPQAEGRLIVGGEAALRLFGLGPRALIKGTLEGTFPSPTKLSAVFDIEVKLPWPLDPYRASFPWEILFEHPPKIEDPVVGAALSHKHVALTWPMVEKFTDLPEPAETGSLISLDVPEPGTDNQIRLVPVDANPLVNFAHAVGDQAGPLAYPQRDAWGTERAGIYEISFGLKGLTLKAVQENDKRTPVEDLHALWIPTPGGGSALQLLSDTPFPGYTASSWEQIVESEDYTFYDEPTIYRHALFFDTLPPGFYTPASDSDNMLLLPVRLGDTVLDSTSGFTVVESDVVVDSGHSAILLAPRESLEIRIPACWQNVQVAVLAKSEVAVTGWKSQGILPLSATGQGSFNTHYDLYGFNGETEITELRIDPTKGTVPVVALLWEISRGFMPPQSPCTAIGNIVLNTHTTYELTVETATKVEVAPQTDGRTDVVVDLANVPSSFIRKFYFRTGGPPDSLSPYFVYASVGDPRPRPEFLSTPREQTFRVPDYRLAPDRGYLAYRRYDVRLHWGAPHVQAMYQESASLHLFDQSGLVSSETWQMTWEKSPYRFLSTADAAWQDEFGESTPNMPCDDLLALRVGHDPLPPEQTLSALVTYTPPNNEDPTDSLFQIEFDTSRYLDLQDHLDSSGHELGGILRMEDEFQHRSVSPKWDLGEILTTNLSRYSSPTSRYLPASISSAVPAIWTSLEQEADAFTQFAQQFRHDSWDESREDDRFVVYAVEETPGRPIGLYLKSPEPFAWERIVIESTLVPPPGYRKIQKEPRSTSLHPHPNLTEPNERYAVRTLKNFDGSAAFLFYERDERLVYLPGGFHELRFSLQWNIGHGAPILSCGAIDNETGAEEAHLRCFVEATAWEHDDKLTTDREQLDQLLTVWRAYLEQATDDTLSGRPVPSDETFPKKGGKP